MQVRTQNAPPGHPLHFSMMMYCLLAAPFCDRCRCGCDRQSEEFLNLKQRRLFGRQAKQLKTEIRLDDPGDATSGFKQTQRDEALHLQIIITQIGQTKRNIAKSQSHARRTLAAIHSSDPMLFLSGLARYNVSDSMGFWQ